MGLRRAAFRSFDDCVAILRLLKSQGFTRVDITGGEPCVFPRLVELVRLAEGELDLRVRVITLGQFLTRPAVGRDLLDQLLDAGLTDLLFSVHAVEETLFHRLTGGSFSPLAQAMDRLDNLGFQYCVNTVVCAENAAHLPEIAQNIAERGAHAHNFILFNAYYRWGLAETAAAMLPPYAELAPHLSLAVSLLERAGVAVNVRYAPLCAFPGLERHMVGAAGVLFDPCEWANRAGNCDQTPAFCAERVEVSPRGVRPCYELTPPPADTPSLAACRGTGFKVFPAACQGCARMSACDGFDPRRLESHGADCVRPVLGPPLQGALLPERLAYLRAFALKEQPLADMRAFHRQLEERP